MPPLAHISVFLCRYDSYGRLTNITYPTGRVSSYRADADSSVRIQTEGSNKEDITVTTNLSASGTFYTLMQGECLLPWRISGAGDFCLSQGGCVYLFVGLFVSCLFVCRQDYAEPNCTKLEGRCMGQGKDSLNLSADRVKALFFSISLLVIVKWSIFQLCCQFLGK